MSKIWISFKFLICSPKGRILIFLFLLISSSTIYAQSNKLQIVVFDTEGKIIKSYGEENGQILKRSEWIKEKDLFNNADYGNGIKLSCKNMGYRLIVEKVPVSEDKLYFLRYQYRKNDYINESNVLSAKTIVVRGEYNTKDHYVYFDIPATKGNKETIISYQLIKTNLWGSIEHNKNSLFYSTDAKGYYQSAMDELITTEVDLLSAPSTTNLANQISNINDKRKENKKEQDKWSEKLKNVQTDRDNRKSRINENITTYKTVIDKLSLLDQANGIVNSINENRDSLIKHQIELINITQMYKDRVAICNDSIAKYKKEKKRLDDQYYKANFLTKEIKNDYLIKSLVSPVMQVLHEGTLIYNTENVKEIIYEYYADTIPNTKKVNINFIRQTPNLPILTVDDKLYAKIINSTPEALKDFRFFANLKVDETKIATEEDLRNGSEFKALDRLGIDSESIIKTTTIGSGNKSINNRESVRIKLDTITYLIVSIGKNTIKLDKSTSSPTDSLITQWMSDVNSESFKADNISQYLESLINNANGLIIENGEIASMKNAIVKLNELIDKQNISNYLTEILNRNNDVKVNYIDYVLKYPKTFKNLTVPKVELYANTYYTEDYKVSIESGEEKRPTFILKKQFYKVVEDELPIVRRKKRYALNAGVAYTPMLNYKYTKQLVEGTQDSYYLEETKSFDQKFVPTLFLSTYIKKTDVYSVTRRSFWETVHVDVGIDYADTDILDNFYVGAGWEFWRNAHLSSGVRLGNVKRIDVNKVNLYSLETSNAEYNEFNVGVYVAINFGFDLIPTAINALLNPAE